MVSRWKAHGSASATSAAPPVQAALWLESTKHPAMAPSLQPASRQALHVCEEIPAPDGYVTDATETVYLSGKDQDVITVTFGNNKMGSLLIVKRDAVTGAPISDVEFLVTDSDGSVIGTAKW